MAMKASGKSAESGNPQLFALSVVKNEADIIELCLRHASQFCDRVFLLDHESDDSTWARVRSLACENRKVIPVGQIGGTYAHGHKALLFDKVRDGFDEGDWVLILDADEFLEVNPKPLLRECNESGNDAIRFRMAQFFVTDLDVGATWFERDAEEPVSSLAELPSYYRIDHTINRMFRYSEDVRWRIYDQSGDFAQRGFPEGPWNLSSKRLVSRHYQYRSKAQMRKRLRVRTEARRKTGCFEHNSDLDWKQYVQDHRDLREASPQEVITPSLRERVKLWNKRHKVGRRLRRAGRRVLASLRAG
jgi:glycosyltransferase involved in cell wall biosynthesis